MTTQSASTYSHHLTTREAAQFLGIAKATLEYWRWEKCGPRYLKLGRAVRYREEDLKAWLDSHQVEPSNPHHVA